MINLRRIFLLVFFLLNTPLAIISLENYIGSSIYYILFSVVAFVFFIYLTDEKSSFFDNFLAIFFFLGYWLSFSIKISFYNSNFIKFSDGFGFFDFSSDSFDEALLVCITSYMAIIVASKITRLIFKNAPNFKFNTNSTNKISKKEFNTSLILLFFSILIAFINFKFHIYQRGINFDSNLNFFIANLIKWLILVGIMFFFVHFIYFFIQKKFYPNLLIFISIVAKFILSLSMLSRAMIFDLSSIFWALFKFENKKKNMVIILVFFLISLFLFFLTINMTSKLRHNVNQKFLLLENFQETRSSNTKTVNESYERITNPEKKKLLDFYERVLISRLHGFEAVMAVVGEKDKGWTLLKNALKEKPGKRFSFFDTLKKDYRAPENSSLKSITLPGIIAFLYYSGSLSFLFISLLIIVLIFSLFEKIVIKITNGNYLLASLISQIIAYRLWHFGYLPLASYKLILSILLFLALVLLFNKKKKLLNFFISK